MRTILTGLALAALLTAVAPIGAGLASLAGLAGEPVARYWMFGIAETLCGMAGIEHPGTPEILGAWFVQHVPVGLLLSGLWQALRREDPVVRGAAFEEAVTAFHAD